MDIANIRQYFFDIGIEKFIINPNGHGGVQFNLNGINYFIDDTYLLSIDLFKEACANKFRKHAAIMRDYHLSMSKMYEQSMNHK